MELMLQSPMVPVQRCHAEIRNGSRRTMAVVAKKELRCWKNSVSGGPWNEVKLQRKSLNGKNVQWDGAGRVVVCVVKEEGQEVVNSSSRISEKGSSSSVLTFLCPLLKLIGGGDPAAPRNAFVESATSGIASLARLPWGSQVDTVIAAERSVKGQPPQLFQLYEFELCPYCRRVREALTELDLSAEVYPCPKGSLRHREFVRMDGGKEQFPYFIDPNTGVSMYESSEIVNYLFREYGGGRQPTKGLLVRLGANDCTCREGHDVVFKGKHRTSPKKVELFSYENNQFKRLVREALCELELPYILRNVGKGSSLRASLLKLAGSTQVPYLVDPNSGKSLPESLDIISYLFETYAAKS